MGFIPSFYFSALVTNTLCDAACGSGVGVT